MIFFFRQNEIKKLTNLGLSWRESSLNIMSGSGIYIPQKYTNGFHFVLLSFAVVD